MLNCYFHESFVNKKERQAYSCTHLQNKQVIEKTRSEVCLETHTDRQATQHDCLPSLLGYGDNGIETVYGEGKHIFCWADQRGQGRTKIS